MRTSAAATLLLLAAAAPAVAQVDLFGECQADRVAARAGEVAEPWADALPGAVHARALAALAATGDWGAAARQVTAAFRTAAALAGLDPDVAGRLLTALRAAESDLSAMGGSPEGLEGGGRFRLFVRPTGAELTQLGDGPLAIEPTDPLPEVRAVCWTALAAQRLLDAANAGARDRTLQGLQRAVAAWDAFNESGYASYPWELPLNPPGADLMPPRWQVVLLHPGLAVEIAGFREIESARRADAVLVEPLGVLRYNDARSFYIGASVVASFTDSESPGLGALIHAGPYLKAGYVFRREADGEPDRDGILLTADLLQILRDAPGAYRAARDRVAERLVDRALGLP